MPYIAGLDVHDILRRSPLSHEQGVESIVFLTTLVSIGGGIRNHLKASSRHRHHGHVTNTGIAAPSGKNIGEKQQVPLSVKILGPLAHGFIFIPPVMYLAGTALGRLQQPDWLYAFSLPSDDLTVGQLATVKTLAAFAHFGVLYLLKHTRKHFRAAKKSEKPEVPDKGPYSVVRHPMSSAILLSQTTFALMWWNWIPLAGVALTAGYLAVSLPHEEQVQEHDVATGVQYTAYKQKVAYRLIPYVW